MSTAAYRAANLEKVRATSREWARRHREQMSEEEREQTREKGRQYNEINKEALREKARERARKYQSEDPERVREWGRKYREAHKAQRAEHYRGKSERKPLLGPDPHTVRFAECRRLFAPSILIMTTPRAVSGVGFAAVVTQRSGFVMTIPHNSGHWRITSNKTPKGARGNDYR